MATQLDRLKIRLEIAGTDTSEDVLLQEWLDTAKEIILEYRYPYSSDPTQEVFEARYFGLQVDIAVERYSRMGAEGQITHTENGMQRQYSSSDISKELLGRITPKAGVPSA